MSVRILQVTKGSPADQAGIRADDLLLRINAEEILDEIDYQALSSARIVRVSTQSPDGSVHEYRIVKRQSDPLGLCLDETVTMKPRPCHNRCVFCFIDQLPPHMRETMYVKDDDWRLSMMMGNYVTLTNVDDREFGRLLRRKASPLYISVHATDPDVRIGMMKNPKAGLLMERLIALKEAGIRFHTQVVLCPGFNDGDILRRTVSDLAALYPAARSVAIVPVGLTGHRSGLTELQPFTADTAASLLDLTDQWQREYLDTLGTRFVFPSDEFYCLSGRPLPGNAEYEEYPQIENGVGMLRLLDSECEEYLSDGIEPVAAGLPAPRRLLIGTGVSAAPFIRELVGKYAPEGTQAEVVPVPNHFFGESITVTGLIVGRDLVSALKGRPCDEVLISETMLRENTDSFLDDMTVADVERELGHPVRVVKNNGRDFIEALNGSGGNE